MLTNYVWWICHLISKNIWSLKARKFNSISFFWRWFLNFYTWLLISSPCRQWNQNKESWSSSKNQKKNFWSRSLKDFGYFRSFFIEEVKIQWNFLGIKNRFITTFTTVFIDVGKINNTHDIDHTMIFVNWIKNPGMY